MNNPPGGGDMLKSTYDTDNDGKVDQAEDADTLDGSHAADFAPAGHNHDGAYDPLGEADAERGDHETDFNHSLLHSNANDPSADEKAALPGTSGTPGSANKYVTNADPRNSDARTPTSHGHAGADITSGTLDGDRLPALSSSKKGGVPATGTPSGKYLKDDGTWGDPAAAGQAFPVGSVFISVVATNPATLLGYGTWAAFGAGRVLVGLDSGDADFDTVEETGGAKTKAISAHAGTAVANHYPESTGPASSGVTAKGSTASTVTLAAHVHDTPEQMHEVTQPSAHSDLSVVQPYIVVYMWKRTA
jgi:hypothetical protein